MSTLDGRDEATLRRARGHLRRARAGGRSRTGGLRLPGTRRSRAGRSRRRRCACRAPHRPAARRRAAPWSRRGRALADKGAAAAQEAYRRSGGRSSALPIVVFYVRAARVIWLGLRARGLGRQVRAGGREALQAPKTGVRPSGPAGGAVPRGRRRPGAIERGSRPARARTGRRRRRPGGRARPAAYRRGTPRPLPGPSRFRRSMAAGRSRETSSPTSPRADRSRHPRSGVVRAADQMDGGLASRGHQRDVGGARCVVVATGYSNVPRSIDWPSAVKGTAASSSDSVELPESADLYRGRDVLGRRGTGNSGARDCRRPREPGEGGGGTSAVVRAAEQRPARPLRRRAGARHRSSRWCTASCRAGEEPALIERTLGRLTLP